MKYFFIALKIMSNIYWGNSLVVTTIASPGHIINFIRVILIEETPSTLGSTSSSFPREWDIKISCENWQE